MNIDWSKAPEGATHFCPVRKTWLKQGEHCMWLSWSPFGRINEEVLIGWTFCHPPEDEASLLTKEWTGEDLPPTGTVCEYKRVHEWQKVEVFAVKPNYNGSNTALFTFENGRWSGCAEPSFFRPILTPEQIAAEERDRKIKDLYFTVNWNEGRETWDFISRTRKADYAKAIDAGWQQVKP